MATSLQKTLVDYLTAIRSDAANPRRIDHLIHVVEHYKKTPLSEAHAYSESMAGFINLLHLQMPEIKKADPKFKKIFPVYEYFEKLPKPKPKKRPKSSGPA